MSEMSVSTGGAGPPADDEIAEIEGIMSASINCYNSLMPMVGALIGNATPSLMRAKQGKQADEDD